MPGWKQRSVQMGTFAEPYGILALIKYLVTLNNCICFLDIYFLFKPLSCETKFSLDCLTFVSVRHGNKNASSNGRERSLKSGVRTSIIDPSNHEQSERKTESEGEQDGGRGGVVEYIRGQYGICTAVFFWWIKQTSPKAI